jgi:hypothetical protein
VKHPGEGVRGTASEEEGLALDLAELEAGEVGSENVVGDFIVGEEEIRQLEAVTCLFEGRFERFANAGGIGATGLSDIHRDEGDGVATERKRVREASGENEEAVWMGGDFDSGDFDRIHAEKLGQGAELSRAGRTGGGERFDERQSLGREVELGPDLFEPVGASERQERRGDGRKGKRKKALGVAAEAKSERVATEGVDGSAEGDTYSEDDPQQEGRIGRDEDAAFGELGSNQDHQFAGLGEG